MRDNRARNKSDSIRDRMRSSPKSSSRSSTGLSSIWAEQKQIEKEELIERNKRKEIKKQKLEQRKISVKNTVSKNKSKLVNSSKYKKVLPVGAMIVLLVAVVVSFNVFSNDTSTGTLGDSTSSELAIQEDLPREKPSFSLLFPAGSSSEEYDVVRISPENTAASYTYLDRFTEDGAIFRVTQQEIPNNFDLAKTATDFQATSIIQIDDNIIYHGYSEKGGIQSLIFIKDEKLISIRSPQKFPDNTWAGYVISLN